MADKERDFKGVWIPRIVWLDERLNALDKMILTEIDSLDISGGGCWASNKYISDFCQCSERAVSSSISKLIECGYLSVKSFDGRQRILQSKLSKFCKTDSQNLRGRVEKSARQDGKNCDADTKNLRDNNTYNNTNNKTMNIDIGNKRKPFVPPTLEDIEAYCLQRKNNVDPQKFYDYFTASDWVDSKGKKVYSWKQKVITWEGFNKEQKTVGANGIPINNKPSDLDGLF